MRNGPRVATMRLPGPVSHFAFRISCFLSLPLYLSPRHLSRLMRKLTITLVVLLVAHLGLLFVGPRGAESAAAVGADPNAPTVGIVFDVGGRGDKSFND